MNTKSPTPLTFFLHSVFLGCALFLCSLTLPACPSPSQGDASPQENGSLDHAPLIDAKAWTLTPTSEDPYTSRRPDKVTCPPEVGYGFELFNEEPSFQVITGECNYITVQQTLRRSLRKDDQLHLRLWYFSLSSFDATEAFASIRIGEHEIWSKTLPLPARSNLEYPTLPIPQDIPASTQIFFHVDNHGANSWHLLELSISRP
ncbi:MAG: hypothetical protein H6727_04285 [Myxococcales bacterium]|nr:hypothetical protein [Myxococcales bacterium]